MRKHNKTTNVIVLVHAWITKWPKRKRKRKKPQIVKFKIQQIQNILNKSQLNKIAID